MSQNNPAIASHEVVDAATLTPAERERRKSPVKKAEDVIYVITHTVTCLTCDVLSPLIGPILSRNFGKLKHAVVGGPLPEKLEPLSFRGWLKHVGEWFEAELVGDALSVIPVIATQRFAPGFVDKLDKGMENVFGGLYRWGAERETRKWAVNNGIVEGSAEFRAHSDKIYRDESAHFGQMLEWTVLSTGLNVLWQKYKVNPTLAAEEQRALGEILRDKVGAGLMASAIVMGSRATFPKASQHRDRFMGKHVILPVTTVLAKPFGIDAESVREASSEKFGIADDRRKTAPSSTVNENRSDATPVRAAANENVAAIGEKPTNRIERMDQALIEPQRVRPEAVGLQAS